MWSCPCDNVHMLENEITHVRQAHAISQSSYMMPASSRKLIFFAMAYSKYDNNGFKTIEVESADIVKGLGMSKGGEQYEQLKKITKETKKQVYTIEDDGYEHVSWMAQCAYVKSRDVFKFRLDNSLIGYVRDLKSHYSFIPLHGIGKLQGKYAIRLFELLLINAGYEGKNGNKKGEWWYEDTIKDLRHRFEIKDDEYKVMSDFRKRVIDKPIQEINKGDVGIYVTPEYLRKGKRLLGIRFNVKKIKSSDPKIISPVTQSENEEDALKKKHPDLFKKYLKEELKQGSFDFIPEDMKIRAAEDRALEKIRKITSKKVAPKKAKKKA